ncbi:MULTISPECIES: SDR family NAD(P)-dependent oxidoreductase [unclassified Microbacterium]|uniref:SDR family NAD(P)-dependent oxidoreductase n=1 Tax=unclassified Microbacterium TaxID=2609290 RepID=UPI003019187D
MRHATPDLSGRTYAITGGTGGIGYFAAEHLAAAGAHVVLLSRTDAKLRAAREAIARHTGSERTTAIRLDLTSLDSVEDAAGRLRHGGRLDGIFLNGGPMRFSARALTRDGLPLMIGAHAVANAALALGVIPVLADTGREGASRIVHASTGFVGRFARRIAPVRDVASTGIAAYVQAKALTEVFAREMHRRLEAAGLPILSLLSHPGVAVDAKTPTRVGVHDRTTGSRANPYTPWAHGKDGGAWIGVRALTDPAAVNGAYYAPEGRLRGEPVVSDPSPITATLAPRVAADIWDQLLRFARNPDTHGL